MSDREIRYSLEIENGIYDETNSEYELIDCSDKLICAEHRSAQGAKDKLISIALSFGGNCVKDVKVKPFERNSIGFSIQMYEATGKVCLAAKKDDNGEYSRSDLENMLSHYEIDRYVKNQSNSRKMSFVLKVIGVILFCIFTVGFLMSN